MPLPLFFIGTAAISATIGIGTNIKAAIDNKTANDLNNHANHIIENAKSRMEQARTDCGTALEKFGELKVYVLNHSIKEFIQTYEQIHNVDLSESEGLKELEKMHVDKRAFAELKEMQSFATSLVTGVISGSGLGALTAFGAYGAAKTFAIASTGTRIAVLHGIAAKNATLAFFGGGSLAAGGLGMAGGAYVLGGLVAGPALMVMGLVTSTKANAKLDNALSNTAQAKEVEEQLATAADACDAIRRRTYMFYALLSQLDARFQPLLYQMKKTVKDEGVDYANFSISSKRNIAAAVSVAKSIKAILDTPILTNEGGLTDVSETVINNINTQLHKEAVTT